MKQFEEERHRVNKYQKELAQVKENNYEQLLAKYTDPVNAVMRHSRYQEMFLAFYAFDQEHNLGITENLDEIKKYVNSRDDKINYLQNKIKRNDKELEIERNRSKDYLTEIQTTAQSFDEISALYEAKSGDIKEANDSFNKLYKEKHNEKLAYQQELSTLHAKIKSNTEQIHYQSENVNELNKEKELMHMQIKELEVSNWAQRSLLEELNGQKQLLLQDIENTKTKTDISAQKLTAFDARLVETSKEFGRLKKDAIEKSKMLEQFLRATRAGEDLDIKDMSNEQMLYERMELKRLRVTYFFYYFFN
jgi:chromosome segregation ATPase